jgi:hypothetical protein
MAIDNFKVQVMCGVKIGDQSIVDVCDVDSLIEIPLALYESRRIVEAKLMALALDNTSVTKLHEGLKIDSERYKSHGEDTQKD